MGVSTANKRFMLRRDGIIVEFQGRAKVPLSASRFRRTAPKVEITNLSRIGEAQPQQSKEPSKKVLATQGFPRALWQLGGPPRKVRKNFQCPGNLVGPRGGYGGR
jgi:hypothetical protein